MKRVWGGLIVLVLGLALLASAGRLARRDEGDGEESLGGAEPREDGVQLPPIDLRESGETAEASLGMG